jgi:hypothetical protein
MYAMNHLLYHQLDYINLQWLDHLPHQQDLGIEVGFFLKDYKARETRVSSACNKPCFLRFVEKPHPTGLQYPTGFLT